jgi:hypothetical protein
MTALRAICSGAIGGWTQQRFSNGSQALLVAALVGGQHVGGEVPGK